MVSDEAMFVCLFFFKEKVRCVEGSREFLQALGFISTMLPVDGQGEINYLRGGTCFLIN